MAASEQLISVVDFVGLPTSDLERAAAFYGDTLGLRRAVYMPDRHFAEFETGNLTLSVYNAKEMGLEHSTTPNPLALRVEDVARARAELEGKGVQFNGDTHDTGVCHMAFFRDSEGNSLMLHRRYAPRD
jgi:predicted enzyme related to lactoylglutathione lyase